MKKVLLTLIAALFILVGCQDDNSILEPTNDVAHSLNKGRVILRSNKAPDGFGDLTALTKFKGKYLKKVSVDGTKGGKVSFSYSWKDANNQKVNLSANLIIPRNAYNGTLTFDVIFDLENYGVELYPSPFTFDLPISLNLIFSGVDLSSLDPNNYIFDYLDGASENLKYEYMSVDVKNNMLEISGAQIPHFSRYGWTRITR